LKIQEEIIMSTEQVIQDAVKYAKENGINHIVVASVTGTSLAELCRHFDGNIICVTHAYGYKTPGECEFPTALRAEYEAKDVKFVTAAHVLSGAEEVSATYSRHVPCRSYGTDIAYVWCRHKGRRGVCNNGSGRRFCTFCQKVISLGGTGRGLDAAIVITPGYAQRVFSTQIHKIICKPE
jgi:hypothetical protein